MNTQVQFPFAVSELSQHSIDCSGLYSMTDEADLDPFLDSSNLLARGYTWIDSSLFTSLMNTNNYSSPPRPEQTNEIFQGPQGTQVPPHLDKNNNNNNNIIHDLLQPTIEDTSSRSTTSETFFSQSAVPLQVASFPKNAVDHKISLNTNPTTPTTTLRSSNIDQSVLPSNPTPNDKYPTNNTLVSMLEKALQSNPENHGLLHNCYEWTKPLPPLVAGDISSILNSVTSRRNHGMPDPPDDPSVPSKPNNNKKKSQMAPESNGRSVDLSEYLTLPQNEAAKLLGMATSSLSKKWKEATNSRKWPYRAIMKIDKEIMTLLNNISPHGQLDPRLEYNLGLLLRRRVQELKPIRISR